MSYHVVLLETSSNQDFIFATNRLRENVGASELAHRAGTRIVLDAVLNAKGPDLWDKNSQIRRDHINDGNINRSIFGLRLPDDPIVKVEVIVATSGKGLLLVDSEETGREIIRAATLTALIEAPGLDFRGVVTPVFDDEFSVHRAIKRAHALFERERSRTPGPESRFLRLPFIENCATSGLPAKDSVRPYWAREGGGDRETRSSTSMAKQGAARDATGRVSSLFRSEEGRGLLLESLDKLDDFDGGKGRPEWLAVIHADGNFLGQMFLDFESLSGTEGEPKAYVDNLRRFSLAIEECTEKAFGQALNNLHAEIKKSGRPESKLPVVPIVLGGDDLTVVCDGRYALNLCRDFLFHFEEETKAEGGIITEIVSRYYGTASGLSACAGVAIVKPHYPFHAAYQLAEDLIKSAKKVKEFATKEGGSIPLSAMDVHVHYDASGSDLADIRRKLSPEEGVELMARPFVVSDADQCRKLADPSWADSRHWQRLVLRAKAIRRTDEDGRRSLPNGMLHDLREALFAGREGADARLGLYRSRYQHARIEDLIAGGPSKDPAPSLFWEEGDVHRTSLLDAMDLAEFLLIPAEKTSDVE